jgi:hypothetical protein
LLLGSLPLGLALLLHLGLLRGLLLLRLPLSLALLLHLGLLRGLLLLSSLLVSSSSRHLVIDLLLLFQLPHLSARGPVALSGSLGQRLHLRLPLLVNRRLICAGLDRTAALEPAYRNRQTILLPGAYYLSGVVHLELLLQGRLRNRLNLQRLRQA